MSQSLISEKSVFANNSLNIFKAAPRDNGFEDIINIEDLLKKDDSTKYKIIHFLLMCYKNNFEAEKASYLLLLMFSNFVKKITSKMFFQFSNLWTAEELTSDVNFYFLNACLNYDESHKNHIFSFLNNQIKTSFRKKINYEIQYISLLDTETEIQSFEFFTDFDYIETFSILDSLNLSENEKRLLDMYFKFGFDFLDPASKEYQKFKKRIYRLITKIQKLSNQLITT